MRRPRADDTGAARRQDATVAEGTPGSAQRLIRSAWLRTLATGLALYLVVTIATLATDNPHLMPSLLMLGALLVPVTFVVYVYQRVPIGAEVVPALASCFVVGGLIGTAAAAVLEYETLVELGALPMLAVGTIEESVKLALPLLLFLRRRFLQPSAGVLFGIAAGMGFASFESMGYGLVELIESGGSIGATEALLAARGLVSPAGHAAWTGLVCGVLWRARASGPEAGSRWWIPAAFLTAVGLHSLWDATDSGVLRAAVAVVSLVLLARQLRQASDQRDRRRYPTPRTVSMLSVPKGRSSFSRR
jgi:RsiW-degrading membrane proteinase PrsW (M82 family)